jgi:hypothetical protein
LIGLPAAMQRLKLRLKFRGSIGVPWRASGVQMAKILCVGDHLA